MGTDRRCVSTSETRSTLTITLTTTYVSHSGRRFVSRLASRLGSKVREGFAPPSFSAKGTRISHGRREHTRARASFACRMGLCVYFSYELHEL